MNLQQKQHAVANIIAAEKGKVDHPSDRGGRTNNGITQATATAYGWLQDVWLMPDSMIEDIYITRYIEQPKFDLVFELDYDIGYELIDTGVNMGPATAATFFQRWLNALNARGTRYPDLFVDGRIGIISLDCFAKYLAQRGTEGRVRFLKALNSVQGNRYLELAEKNATQEDFIYGWLARI